MIDTIQMLFMTGKPMGDEQLGDDKILVWDWKELPFKPLDLYTTILKKIDSPNAVIKSEVKHYDYNLFFEIVLDEIFLTRLPSDLICEAANTLVNSFFNKTDRELEHFSKKLNCFILHKIGNESNSKVVYSMSAPDGIKSFVWYNTPLALSRVKPWETNIWRFASTWSQKGLPAQNIKEPNVRIIDGCGIVTQSGDERNTQRSEVRFASWDEGATLEDILRGVTPQDWGSENEAEEDDIY